MCFLLRLLPLTFFIFINSPGIVKPGSIPASLIHLPDNSREAVFEILALVNGRAEVERGHLSDSVL